MTRVSPFRSPLLLGFDRLEEVLDQMSKSQSDGYPPYNVIQLSEDRIRITLAVAGFSGDDLDIMVEGNQLHIKGGQTDDPAAVYLHRGIAARQFQRTFVLAEGINVEDAMLESGLLHIDVIRPDPADRVRKIAIRATPKAARRATRLKTARAGGA